MTTQSVNLSDLDLFASGAPWQEFEKLRAGEPTTEQEWDASWNWHQEQLRRQSDKSPTDSSSATGAGGKGES